MKPASLISSLQSDALAREVERQFKEEIAAVIATAESEACDTVAQARAGARRRMHEAIQELRREGARRLARAKAQHETELRARAQQQAARAVREAFPLLREMLDARWRDAQARRQWADAVARLAATRLRPGAWRVEHPLDWSDAEQRDFIAAVGTSNGIAISFEGDGALAAGLRITADQALLDATPRGLLADTRTIAAMLLDEIGGAP